MNITKQLLGRVEYSNLLTINWNEQKIMTNFKLIVDALSQQQNQTVEYKNSLDAIKEEIRDIKNQMNTLVNSQKQEVKSTQNSQIGLVRQSQTLAHKSSFQDLGKLKQGTQDFERLQKQIEQLRKMISSIQAQTPSDIKRPKGEIILNDKKEENLKTQHKEDYANKIKQEIDNLKSKLKTMTEVLNDLKDDTVKINAKLNLQANQTDNSRKSIRPQKRQSHSKIRNSIKVLTEEKQNNSPQIPQNQIPSTTVTSKIPPIVDDKHNEALEQQVNSLYLDTNTLRLCYEQLKIMVSDLKRADSRKQGYLNDLLDKLNRLNQSLNDQKDRNEKQFKNIRNMLIHNEPEKPVQTPVQKKEQGNRKLKVDQDINYADKMSDKFSKLQALILNTVTQSQFDRYKEEVKDKIKQLQIGIASIHTDIQQTNDNCIMLKDTQEESTKAISKLQSDLFNLISANNEKLGGLDKKINITNSKAEQLKKDIQYVKQDLEYYKNSLMKSQANSIQKTDDQDKLNNSKGMGEIGMKKLEQFRKEFNHKLHDIRAELINAIRDFERKISNKNNFQQDITILFDKIGELKLFLNKKADSQDTRKNFVFLEKKIAIALNSVTKQDQAVQDARIAKKNWFCLSCDKVLDHYQGKIGKHVVWDALNNKSMLKTPSTKIDKHKQSLPTLNTTILRK